MKRGPKLGKRPKEPLDSKSLDRLMRLLQAFPLKPKGQKGRKQAAKVENASGTGQRKSGTDDLVYTHIVSASRFGDDDTQYGIRTLRTIKAHPALNPLNEDARIAAAVYIFQAHMAHRRKTSAKYWVLDSLGPVYPFPLGIRARPIPRWKRSAGSLRSILKGLSATGNHVFQMEADAVVGSRREGMPAELILDAQSALRKAVSWMEAFPGPVELRSRYRELTRPTPESESAGVLAYILNKLYRSAAPSLKIREIENRIAKVETDFLGSNIDADPDLGCRAVRAQINAVKRSNFRDRVEKGIETEMKSVQFQLLRKEIGGSNKLTRLITVQRSMLKEFDQQSAAFRAWQTRIKSSIEDLKILITIAKTPDERLRVADECDNQYTKYVETFARWLSESRKFLDAADIMDGESYGRMRAARRSMREAQTLWTLSMKLS